MVEWWTPGDFVPMGSRWLDRVGCRRRSVIGTPWNEPMVRPWRRER